MQENHKKAQQAKKKKKNRGWESHDIQLQEPLLHIQQSQKVEQSIVQNQIASLPQSGEFKLECKAKKLSEMALSYHVQMSMQLGSGFCSVVYLGQNIHSSQIVCVKVIDYMALGGQAAKKILNREIKYLSLFNCKYIVKLYDVYESISFCYLIMEYCSGGDLYKLMLKPEVLSTLFVREIVEQICRGLIELKGKNLIHRDLKTQNIFLSSNLEVKIGDLGFCVTTTQQNVIDNVGSPIYMSPQVLKGGSHSFESDIYGLGVIWYELLHKRAPWEAKTEEELLQKKLGQKIEFQRVDLCESDAVLLGKCLAINPLERPPVQQILKYCEQLNASQLSKLPKLDEKMGKQQQAS